MHQNRTFILRYKTTASSMLIYIIAITALMVVATDRGLYIIDAAFILTGSNLMTRIHPLGKSINDDFCFKMKKREFNPPFLRSFAEPADHHQEPEDRQMPSSFQASSRRNFLSQQRAFACMLSSLLLGSGSVSAAPDALSDTQSAAETSKIQKTIVMTGANSGIGLEACKQLAKQGHTLILACRSFDKAQKAIELIQDDGSFPSDAIGRLIPAECDLANLASINSFAARLEETMKTDEVMIDTLCLNAGVARNTEAKDCARTKDGFELTGTSVNDRPDVHYKATKISCLFSFLFILFNSGNQPLWSLLS
jgi:hypothetical protein